ncbi:MAG: hypothetical protein KKH78_01175 [Candidatus Altiarchaeota archaeon]|nr:hypothetical protein [Candidatus Altiarchaeota archaeon]
MSDMDVDSLVDKVAGDSGKTTEGIRGMMNQRKEITHGLLSDYGALYAVAKEFGISLDNAETITLSKISDIAPGRPFNIAGRVKMAYPVKEFQRKDSSKGRMASTLLVDDSGETRLVLWDKNSEMVNRVKKGDVILVKNGYGRESMQGGAELHATSMTSMSINPELDANLPEIKENLIKIDKLKPGMGSVDLICRISSHYPPVEFTRSDGSTGMRASFTGEDETGTVRAVLWDSAAKLELERGDFVKLENAYTKQGLSGEIELQAGGRSRVIKTDAAIDLPPLQEQPGVKISDLKEDLQNFSISGRVIQMFPQKPYSNGMMASLVLGDETGTTRVVLWNESSEIAKELKKGDPIVIKNAYSRAGLNGGVEAHAGKYSEIAVNQDLELPSIEDIKESLIKEKSIAELENQDFDIRIKGKVVDIDEGKRPIYMSCPNCSRSIQNTGVGWFCEQCNEDVEPNSNLIASFIIEDETGTVRAICFRENAERILGMDMEEVMNIIGATQDEAEPARKAKESLGDRSVTVVGRVKYSEFSDQLEFIVDEVC